MEKKYRTLAKLKKYCTVLLLSLLVSFLYHRVGYTQGQPDGTPSGNVAPAQYSPKLIYTAVPFLLIGPDARASAMGDANVALADNASAVYWNPAGLGFQNGTEILFIHNQWLPGLGFSDLVLENLMVKFGLEQVNLPGVSGFGFTFLNQGQNIRTGQGSPDPIGTFNSFELAIWLSYGIEVTRGLSVGGSIRFVHSSLFPESISALSSEGSGVASSFSVDIALLWKPILPGWFKDRMSFGFNLSSIGPKIKYVSERYADPQPTNLRLGLAFHPWMTDYHLLTLVLDFNRIIATRYPEDSEDATNHISDDVFSAFISTWGAYGLTPVTVSFGLEYWYGKPKFISFRGGVFYENPEAGGRTYISFGLGFKYSFLGIDFSYLQGTTEDHPLSSTIRASISVAFDFLNKEEEELAKAN